LGETFAVDEKQEAEIAIKKEVLEFELVQLRMARRRAKDEALRVKIIAERELEVEQDLRALGGQVVAKAS
jgi:hypothetical protein